MAVRMQYKVTTSNPPTCVVGQAYVTKKNTRPPNSFRVHAKRTFVVTNYIQNNTVKLCVDGVEGSPEYKGE